MAAPATQYLPLLIFIPLAIFGLLAGYYVTHAIGLVRWRHRTGANDV